MVAVIPSEEQVVQWITSLSNWGRWGEDDQYGCLNLITPIRSETIDDWPRIASTRIRDPLNRVRRGDQKVFDEILDGIADERDYEIMGVNSDE